MGLGFVLFFWAIAGTILAGIGAVILGVVTGFLTRRVGETRKRAIILASVFPFVCLGWAGVLFLFQAIINGALLHRDAGLGDTWECPLPNGYAITMIDVTDQGWVYNPRTQSGGGIGEQEDAVAGVRTLQVAGRYVLEISIYLVRRDRWPSPCPTFNRVLSNTRPLDCPASPNASTGSAVGVTCCSPIRC